jgi:hypothetical protein
MDDRGMIIDWLVTQPEIFDVAIEPAGEDDRFLCIELRNPGYPWPAFPRDFWKCRPA